MAKDRHYTPLGEAELEMLQHVWHLREATVADVHEQVLEEREVAYTTVMSILKKLADKGYLQYEREGRAYVYSPARRQEEVQGEMLSEIIDRVFSGSAVALAQRLAKQEDLSEEERAEIRQLIKKMGPQSGSEEKDT